MKEVERKQTPEISGGEVDAYGNPLPVAYPIYELPIEQPSPLTIPQSPCPEPQP